MIFVTGLITALFNNFFFTTGLMGARVSFFMMILLCPFAFNLKQGHIPLDLRDNFGFCIWDARCTGALKMDNICSLPIFLGGIYGNFRFAQKDFGAIRGASWHNTH